MTISNIHFTFTRESLKITMIGYPHMFTYRCILLLLLLIITFYTYDIIVATETLSETLRLVISRCVKFCEERILEHSVMVRPVGRLLRLALKPHISCAEHMFLRSSHPCGPVTRLSDIRHVQ